MERHQVTQRVALLGIILNIILLIGKLIVGFASRSQAMIADGFNSAGDVFSSLMTYIGNRIASQPEDQNHPYGHGKAEYIFSMIISFSLLLVAISIFRESLDSILHREIFIFSWWLIGVAIATIVLKLSLFIYTNKVGKLHNSLLILANAEDHRNDVFVTSATLLGILLGKYGIYWLDGVVGIGISIWIAYTGFRIFMDSFNVLMDTNIDQSFKEDIMGVILSVQGVDHIDDIIAKPVGFQVIIIAKVSVNGNLTINEGHSIAAQIREKLRGYKHISDVVVHVNPC